MRPHVAALLVLAIAPAPAPAADVAVLDPAARFPEGPVFRGDEILYAQYGGHAVSRIDPASGAVSELWREEGCGPSAVLPLGDGLLVACYDSGALVELGPDAVPRRRWQADDAGAPLVGPNDLAPDGAGGAWLTASGPWESAPIVGAVLHLGADGALRRAADDLHYANGVALAPDGSRLFVAESEAGRIVSFAVGPDGALGDRRLFARLAALDPASGVGAYPDGIEFGPDGNLWIGQFSSGRLLAVAPDGTLAAVVEVPAPSAPNLAFDPAGGRLIVAAVDDPANPPYPGKLYALPLP